MQRSRAIFEWIYNLPGVHPYELSYLASTNVGLSEEALHERRLREANSLQNIFRLKRTYRSMRQVWNFLNTQHDLYTASKLVAASAEAGVAGESDLLKLSYGGGSTG